jgi:RNA 3'-terminal phosphate cyclase (ATP)
MEAVLIDGAEGEGGGQILRTSLALACITGKSLRIENIRAARRNPGLARQHLCCVQAAAEICHARLEGATLRSQQLEFHPGSVRGGSFSFDIGSAGSASLVLQTVLPALFLAQEPSTITVSGGTHNPMAPPFDFLQESFLPAIASAGFRADCRLVRHGFFPAGGGRMVLRVTPRTNDPHLTIDLSQSPREYEILGRIYLARLPAHIAKRQQRLLRHSTLDVEDIEHIEAADSNGPGNCVMIRLCAGGRTTVLTAFGMRGRPSEQVVEELVNMARAFLNSGAAVDRFLADQLLIYMAICGAGCCTTSELSGHIVTNIETIKKLLPVDFSVCREQSLYRISCRSL